MQPWRFVVVQDPEQRRRLRAAGYNQGKIEEASAVIVACGDADGWRRDLDLMLEHGPRRRHARELRRAGPQHRSQLPLQLLPDEKMHGWLNKQVMLAVSFMLLTAETLGYDTAPMEGFEQDKVHEALRLPLELLRRLASSPSATSKAADKFFGGRFDSSPHRLRRRVSASPSSRIAPAE